MSCCAYHSRFDFLSSSHFGAISTLFIFCNHCAGMIHIFFRLLSSKNMRGKFGSVDVTNIQDDIFVSCRQEYCNILISMV